MTTRAAIMITFLVVELSFQYSMFFLLMCVGFAGYCWSPRPECWPLDSPPCGQAQNDHHPHAVSSGKRGAVAALGRVVCEQFMGGAAFAAVGMVPRAYRMHSSARQGIVGGATGDV